MLFDGDGGGGMEWRERESVCVCVCVCLCVCACSILAITGICMCYVFLSDDHQAHVRVGLWVIGGLLFFMIVEKLMGDETEFEAVCYQTCFSFHVMYYNNMLAMWVVM